MNMLLKLKSETSWMTEPQVFDITDTFSKGYLFTKKKSTLGTLHKGVLKIE